MLNNVQVFVVLCTINSRHFILIGVKSEEFFISQVYEGIQSEDSRSKTTNIW